MYDVSVKRVAIASHKRSSDDILMMDFSLNIPALVHGAGDGGGRKEKACSNECVLPLLQGPSTTTIETVDGNFVKSRRLPI